jgi:hypothetical protein
MKKILVALLFAAVIGTGAFAQLMIGVSGALHMDESLTAKQIADRFDKGDGIFYGPSIEIAGKHLGFGFAANISYYERDATFIVVDPTDIFYFGQAEYVPGAKFADYDLTLYLSYHLFGARAFLDPFGEFGGGLLATGFENDSDSQRYNPYSGSFFAASYYWYAVLGLGVNLGPIGIFGKFAFDYPLKKAFQDTFKSELDSTGTKQDLYAYGYDEILYPDGYLPKFRFTAGVKLIL